MTVVTTVLHPENDPTVDLHPETDAGQVTDFLNKTYPVNSIYMSVDSTSPASLFGGSWARIQNGFLLSAGYNSIPNGQTGGSLSHTISSANLPGGTISYIQNKTGSAKATSSYTHAYVENTIAANHYGFALRNVSNSYWDENFSFDQPLDTTPPYIAVYMWKRVA